MERRCPNCGVGLPPNMPLDRCPNCGTDLSSVPPEVILFDNPSSVGFLRALWETWRTATFSPNAFFPRVSSSRIIGWPLLYAAICSLLGNLVAVLYNLIWPVNQQALANLPPALRRWAEFSQLSPEGMTLAVVMAPIMAVITSVIVAAICHGLLYLFGGVRYEFAVTLRTVCYTYGAVIFQLIPKVGGFFVGIWWLVLTILGLARAHEIEEWRSALAVLLPFLLCCFCCAASAALFAAALFRHFPPGAFPGPR